LIPAYERSTGVPIDRPVRIFAIEKGGGQWLDRACVVQANPLELANSPYYYVFIAHELFHQWLGGYVRRPDEKLVWFKEGFTDYFATYHITGAGLATPEWFVGRVLELNREARATPAFDKVAFADPSVAWRADANEDYAYKGGTILAFCLDAELYARGKGPLARLISELAKRPGGIYDLEAITEWLRANGVGDLVDRYIAKPSLPDPRELMPKIGYTLKTVKLSYLGIKTESGKGRGTVVAIDPEGPAATTGINVGDVITNTSARLFDRPDIFAAPNEYRFGLELFDASKGKISIEVERDGAKHVYTLVPGALGEGHFWNWNHAKGEKTFFNR
jgi:predicted metalloprotease with PDZ domain